MLPRLRRTTFGTRGLVRTDGDLEVADADTGHIQDNDLGVEQVASEQFQDRSEMYSRAADQEIV